MKAILSSFLLYAALVLSKLEQVCTSRILALHHQLCGAAATDEPSGLAWKSADRLLWVYAFRDYGGSGARAPRHRQAGKQ